MAKQLEQVRFTQIVVAQWHGDGKVLTYSVYGLTADGKVYQQTGIGWKPIRMNIRTQEEYEKRLADKQADAELYG